MKTLVKLVVVIAVVAVIWKEGIPRWQQRQQPGSTASAAASGVEDSCVPAAESAAEMWGSGVGRFANPPYEFAHSLIR